MLSPPRESAARGRPCCRNSGSAADIWRRSRRGCVNKSWHPACILRGYAQPPSRNPGRGPRADWRRRRQRAGPEQSVCRLPHRECAVGHSQLERLRSSASAGLGCLSALAPQCRLRQVPRRQSRDIREVSRSQGHAAAVQPGKPGQRREPAEDVRRLPHGAVRLVSEEQALPAAAVWRHARTDVLDVPRRGGGQPAFARGAGQSMRAVPRRLAGPRSASGGPQTRACSWPTCARCARRLTSRAIPDRAHQGQGGCERSSRSSGARRKSR